MTRTRALAAAAVLVATLLAGGCVAPFDGDGESSTPDEATPTPTATTPSPPPAAHEGYAQTTVTFLDGETGEELGVVGAAVANDGSLRYTGLSETDELPEDRGMLFTYDSERDLTYVMRNMSFGIDIVYVAANGTITSIHHAPEPQPGEDGESQGYPGAGQYVVEVNYGWTAERGVEGGDRVEFELSE